MSARTPNFLGLDEARLAVESQRAGYIAARRRAAESAWRLMFDWADVWDEGPLLAVPQQLWPQIVAGSVGEPIPIWHFMEAMIHIRNMEPRPEINMFTDGFWLLPYEWIQEEGKASLFDWISQIPFERPKREPSIPRHDWTIFVRRFRRGGRSSWGLLLDLPPELRPAPTKGMLERLTGSGGGYQDRGVYAWFEDSYEEVTKLVWGMRHFLFTRQRMVFPKRPHSSPGKSDVRGLFLLPSE